MTDKPNECPLCGSMSNLPWEHEEDCWIRMWLDQYEDWFTNGFNGEFDRDRALEHKFDRHSNDDMLAAWNTRYKRTCEWSIKKGGTFYDVYQCSACGYEYAESRTDHGIKVELCDAKFCPNCGAEVVDD